MAALYICVSICIYRIDYFYLRVLFHATSTLMVLLLRLFFFASDRQQYVHVVRAVNVMFCVQTAACVFFFFCVIRLVYLVT